MRRLGLVIAFLPLFGCNTPDAVELAAVCPSAGVLLQASSVTKLRPGGADPTAALLTANMSQAQLACDYDEDDRTVEADVSLPITVTRGPAGQGAGPQTLEYFVTVVDASGSVLSKRNFRRVIDLGTRDIVNLTERVSGTEITIPAGRMPYQYEIIAGFQLTPAELAFNQRLRTPRP